MILVSLFKLSILYVRYIAYTRRGKGTKSGLPLIFPPSVLSAALLTCSWRRVQQKLRGEWKACIVRQWKYCNSIITSFLKTVRVLFNSPDPENRAAVGPFFSLILSDAVSVALPLALLRASHYFVLLKVKVKLSTTPWRRMGECMYRSTFSSPRHLLQGSFTHPPLYPQYPLDRRLGGLQSRSGRRGEDKILDPTKTRTPTPRPSCP
jgi:hypothetical protein